MSKTVGDILNVQEDAHNNEAACLSTQASANSAVEAAKQATAAADAAALAAITKLGPIVASVPSVGPQLYSIREVDPATGQVVVKTAHGVDALIEDEPPVAS